jgi:hypothetical protein
MGKLIWLASYPKSGNTWLRAFLHNYLRNPEKPYDINRLLDFTATENDAGLYKAYDPRPASQFSFADVQRMRPLLHRDLTESFPGSVFVKTHNAALAVEGVPLQTPDVTAGSIYIVRDPRDIAISYASHLGVPIDRVIRLMGDPAATVGGDDAHVFERLGSWSLHIQSWAGRRDPRCLLLRYEDMQIDPLRSFGRVVAFLGTTPDPDRLAQAIRFSAFDQLRDQEQSNGFIERPAQSQQFFRSGRSGQWRDLLTPAQRAQIEADHGVEMERCGYSLK